MPRPRADGARARAPRRFNLTQRRIDRLPVEPLPYNVWDRKTPGLCVRQYPSGKRAWYCVYRARGKAEWLYAGDARLISHDDAKKKMRWVAVMLDGGKDPVAERRAARNQQTFAEVVERYFNEYASKRNKSWRQADALVRRFLLPRWGSLAPASITRGDVRMMVSSIAAPITANQTLAAASAIFNWCVGMEIVTVNPCRGVEGNPTNSRSRVLSDDEIKKFWRAFDTAGLVRGSVLLLGQRPGETRCMRREHVVDGWWMMPGPKMPDIGWPGTKNGEDHRVWLPAPARAIINELIDGEPDVGFVFATERGGPIGGLDVDMRRICADLGVADPARPHDLRRTHGTTITRLGFGRDAMNRIQNHKEGGIADVYDRHRYETENRRVMEAVAAHVEAIVTGEPDADNVVRLAPPA